MGYALRLASVSLQNSHRFTLSPLLVGVVLPRSLVGQSPLPLSLVSTLRPRVGGLQLPHSLQGANTDTPYAVGAYILRLQRRYTDTPYGLAHFSFLVRGYFSYLGALSEHIIISRQSC